MNASSQDLTPEAMLARLERSVTSSGYSSWLAARPLKCWQGEAELEIPVRPEMTQHHGYVHGSILGAAADNACAWAAASVAGDVVTSEYKIHLLAPAKGQKVLARGKVVRAGRRQVVTQAEVFALDGEQETLVAIATATIATVSKAA